MPHPTLPPRLRVGDVVTFVVVSTGDPARHLRLSSIRDTSEGEYLLCTRYEPAFVPLEVGVRVRHRTQPAAGHLRSVVGPWAWVEWDHAPQPCSPVTVRLDELEAE